MYLVISVILVMIVLYEMLSMKVSLMLASAGLAIGLIIGLVAARMFRLSWDKDARQVISRLDMFGVIILVLYLLISIFRNTILSEFVEKTYITGTSISIVTGVMIGRVFGTGRRIRAILKEEKILG